MMFGCVTLHAQTIPLRALNHDDFDVVASELSTSVLFSDVGAAATLGHVFGFEVGVVGGLTNTAGIHRLAREADPGANVKQVPNANVFAAVTLPLALTVEGGVLPRIGGKDYRFENFGLALKWTPTELFFALPLDLAVRAQTVKSGARLRSVVDGAPTQLTVDARAVGFEAVVSKNFGILTPFASVGAVQARADLNASGGSVFDSAFSVTQSATAKPSGALYRAGLEVHLLVLNAAVEYERALGTDRFNAKFAVGF